MKTPIILPLEFMLESANPHVSLSALIKNHLHGAYVDLHLQLTLHVAPVQKVEIVDDLLDCMITHSSIRLVLDRNAQATYRCVMVPKADTENTFFTPDVDKKVTVVCAGEGAHADVVITCLGQAQRRFNIKTVQDHVTKSTTSMVMVKGVFDDESQLRCDTLIRVEPEAHQVQAEQTNKNLMLSQRARAVAIPKLEVLANDVHCSHGAAMSQIDSEQLFYLQSRGMSAVDSRQLLIDAFLQG